MTNLREILKIVVDILSVDSSAKERRIADLEAALAALPDHLEDEHDEAVVSVLAELVHDLAFYRATYQTASSWYFGEEELNRRVKRALAELESRGYSTASG